MEKLGTREPYQVAKRLGLGVEGYQKARRWIEQDKPLRWEDAALMLDILGWLRTEETPIEQIEAYIKRLDAGERIPARDRERVAARADRLGQDLHHLAERIREGVRAENTDR